MTRLLQRTGPASVFVDATTVDLAGEDLVVEFEPEWTANALVEADSEGDGARILCGQEIGHVAVTAELWDGAPVLDTGDWQDVSETSVTWRTAFVDFGTTDQGDDRDKRLDLPAPGTYRLRVHGRNRDDGDPRDDTDPVEEYLVQMWPAPFTEPAVHKATSRTFAYWSTR